MIRRFAIGHRPLHRRRFRCEPTQTGQDNEDLPEHTKSPNDVREQDCRTVGSRIGLAHDLREIDEVWHSHISREDNCRFQRDWSSPEKRDRKCRGADDDDGKVPSIKHSRPTDPNVQRNEQPQTSEAPGRDQFSNDRGPRYVEQTVTRHLRGHGRPEMTRSILPTRAYFSDRVRNRDRVALPVARAWIPGPFGPGLVEGCGRISVGHQPAVSLGSVSRRISRIAWRSSGVRCSKTARVSLPVRTACRRCRM